MATDKWVARLEAKLDALLEKAGIKPDDVKGATPAAPRARRLTAAEKEAIANAPKTPTADELNPPARAPRVTAQNAPDTSSSVPKADSTDDTAKAPPDAVGSVTVETEEPDGDMTVDTRPASAVRGKR